MIYGAQYARAKNCFPRELWCTTQDFDVDLGVYVYLELAFRLFIGD